MMAGLIAIFEPYDFNNMLKITNINERKYSPHNRKDQAYKQHIKNYNFRRGIK